MAKKMKILSITEIKSFKITTDDGEFIRDGYDCWYEIIGDARWSVIICDDLEELYQEWISINELS